MRTLFLLSACGLLLSTPTLAGDGWDAADESALQETQKMMMDPALRAAAIKGDADATQAADQVKANSGGDKAKEDQTYALAMQMFTKIAKEEGGDPDKIQARLNQYMANPDSLGGMMTDDQKAQLRGLASQQKK